ncbi:hypothetical protein EZV62_010645 [Acer yangbiense]|uniref:Retroviral polymerase SH3-like domain-containing protein n=1 Tax=Acer yangbiense TaxID=1000413 RepID=A0A5C7I323_9ROSI|nr:hypothetical protein EZV62_010645 [Acer yangbiense]
MGMKFEIENFTGENDFGLWKMKMKAVLVKEGLDIALDGEEKLPTDMDTDEKNLLKKAYNSLIMCLEKRVLREVSKETTTAEVQAAITAKDAKIRVGEKKTNVAEGLIIRGHLKNDCTNKDHSKAKKQDDNGDAAMVLDGYGSSEKQGLLGNVKVSKLDFCETCVLGKATKVKFDRGKHVTKQTLDYVHFDLYGLSKVPSLGGARVFGCPAYVHIKQGKLEPRAMKGVFLGYPEEVKGYKIWCQNGNSGKSVISRDVTFNELEMLRSKVAKSSSKVNNQQTIDIDPFSKYKVDFEVETSKKRMESETLKEDLAEIEEASS